MNPSSTRRVGIDERFRALSPKEQNRILREISDKLSLMQSQHSESDAFKTTDPNQNPLPNDIRKRIRDCAAQLQSEINIDSLCSDVMYSENWNEKIYNEVYCHIFLGIMDRFLSGELTSNETHHTNNADRRSEP